MPPEKPERQRAAAVLMQARDALWQEYLALADKVSGIDLAIALLEQNQEAA